MTRGHKILGGGLLSALMLLTGPAMAAEDSTSPAKAEADNSSVNKKHDGTHGLNAEDQGNSEADVETTRKIRRALTEDESLSTYAQNVKIITRNGKVVLKGPVSSAEEKAQVESTATKVAGPANVKSELNVDSK